VKAFSLARARQLGRVRSGYGSGNRVKAFFLSGMIGLAGLSLGKAKNIISGLF
jgi:hypothetical protein